MTATPNPGPQSTEVEVDVQTVHYPSGNSSIEAFMAKPKGSGKHPAVLVVHDNLGLDNTMKDVTRRLAEEGFVAFTPNLLSRSSGSMNPQATAAAVASLPTDQTVDDLKAGFTFLQNDSDVDSSKISSIGFGWGGWRTFEIATEFPSLYRGVIFYGATPTDNDHLRDIHASILALYAQMDFQITGNSVWTEQQLGKKFTYYIYPNTTHGFFGGSAAGNGSLLPANPDVAKLAWTKTLEFLRR
jgi:carboxymethylenebutenolidase